jgi:hypothetical protein
MTKSKMSNVLKFPFGEVYYYNTDNIEAVKSSVIKASKLAADRFSMPQQIMAPENEVESIAGETCVGLFYLSSSFSEVYTKTFILDTPTSTFGSHADFFKRLTANGILEGTDYEAYPRGFTFYDAEYGLYALAAGNWITEAMTAKICGAFNFNHVDSAYYAVRLPLYTYRNNGGSDLLPFIKDNFFVFPLTKSGEFP